MKQMTNHILLHAKALTDAEQSNAIVVSFAAKWHQHLLSRDFSLVIRKRVPRSRTFEWLYFHINSPVGAICGRAQIKHISNMKVEHAIALANKINLSPEEIKSYLAGDTYIGCYKLGAFQFGKMQVHTTKLATRTIYHPPQSFLILSKQGKKIIDEMAGFSQLEANRSRRTQKQ
jgi:predicted transcriptional regulator